MALQAYFDESYDHQTFALAGVISTVEKWADFSAEWERLLPDWGVLGKDGRYHFHTSEMAAYPERQDRIAAFWHVICDHVQGGFAVSVFPQDLADVTREFLQIPGVLESSKGELGPFAEPYGFCLLHAVSRLINEPMVHGWPVSDTDAIDFIFDDNSHKKRVTEYWQMFRGLAKVPSWQRISNDPMFRSDADFLPLQAADLVAWLIRAGIEPPSGERRPLTVGGSDRALPVMFKHITRDDIVTMLSAVLSTMGFRPT